jgi:hypothetical protein
VVLRLVAAACFLLPLIGDPRELALPLRIFWACAVVGWMAFFVHTLRLARSRTRLRLDRKTAKLVAVALGGFKNYACPLHDLRLGAVEVLKSDEGEDAADTYCLQLGFGVQQVQAFVAHDEGELSDLREQLSAWLQANALTMKQI